MPRVGKKHYPYTEKGKAAAKRAKKSLSKKGRSSKGKKR
jgi:hypothetical protein